MRRTDPIPPEDFGSQAIILDVNALMSPFQMGINIDLELSKVVPERVPVVPMSVVRELESLIEKGNDWKPRAALELSTRYQRIDIRGKGDAPIFNLAVRMSWPVMTMDRRLRKKLIERGIQVVFIRGKSHLELLDP
ncbi:MAG TPA: DNA-binding protein [Euryarchaeota archaeon]|nr:MAG: DNA-binding protein [Thermoplasmata archaeon]HHD16665.1 DNA-binding protein [Euryarchaeota archaeon]